MTPQQHFKPFQEAKNWLRVHRSLIQIVMLKLTGSEWKIFCFIMGQTLYEQSRDSEYEAGLSYKDIMKGSGVKSSATVASSLKRLRDLKYIVVSEGSGDWESYRYSLNMQMEVDLVPDELPTSKIKVGASTSKNKAGSRSNPTSKIEVDAALDSEELNRYIDHEKIKESASTNVQASFAVGTGQEGSKGADQTSGHNVQVLTHKMLLDAYEHALGYKIPEYGKEGVAAKKLITTAYVLNDILGCYQFLKTQEFYATQHVSLQIVYKQIGAWIAAGRPVEKPSTAPRRQVASEEAAAPAARPHTRLSGDETRNIFGGESYGVHALMAKQAESGK